MDGDSEAELLEYREKVIAELERRTVRLRDIEGQIHQLEFAIEASQRGRKIMAGGVARIQVEAAHRARLKDSLRALCKDKAVATADLHKAESRLVEVDRRLEDLRR